MTIKPFKIEDLGYFTPNEFSDPDAVLPIMVNMEVKTMWGSDKLVQAILCVKNYWGRCWVGFILVAKNFDYHNAVGLRDLIHSEMAHRNAQRLQTDSVSNLQLRAWHEFLGFQLEGTKRKMMGDQDYDFWAIVREGA